MAGLGIGLVDLGMAVEFMKEMVPERSIARFEFCGLADEAFWMETYFPGAGDTCRGKGFVARGDEIFHLAVDQAAEDELAMGAGTG